MKVGVFDSGLGGLVLLRAMVEKLPEYNYYYYGDTAHLPYGDKTETKYSRTPNRQWNICFQSIARLLL